MTKAEKDEAVKVLKQAANHHNDAAKIMNPTWHKTRERICRLAIEALQQHKCEDDE